MVRGWLGCAPSLGAFGGRVLKLALPGAAESALRGSLAARRHSVSLEPRWPADASSAAQIFLRSNALMKRPLEQKDVKRRLLGHWGTCPGLNFAYAHTTHLISELESKGEEPDWLFVTGVSFLMAQSGRGRWGVVSGGGGGGVAITHHRRFRAMLTLARPRSARRPLDPLPRGLVHQVLPGL